ncbi:MAG: amidohydrolase [Acidobacteria bacterium]|nr:amidohydrolase [Acidobacteriota bacterium]
MHGCAGEPPAQIYLHSARIWTGDPKLPWASSMIVREGRIVAFDEKAKAETVIDAGGATVTPGFIDAHVHVFEGGRRLKQVQLRECNSKEEFVRRLGDYSADQPRGEWILGGDWDHQRWGGELPDRKWIDGMTNNHPVWVTRLDGHMGLANAPALRVGNINRNTPDPPGGVIVRGPDGEPTGILKDNAMDLLTRSIPQPSEMLRGLALDAAMTHLLERGVTGIHHMGALEDLDILNNFRKEGRLRLRIYAATPLGQWKELREWIKQNGRGDSWMKPGLLKGFVDGSLGSHTAAMEEPYTDAPHDKGLMVTNEYELYDWVLGADKAGLQLAIHAIGDRANHLLLDTYERVAHENGQRDRRFRVEHAQHLRPQDIARFAALGVIASVQPYHAIDDGRWAARVVGPARAKTSYAIRSLLEAKARLAFGSDWFVAPPEPLMALYAAVTRRTLDEANPGGWVPEQKIPLEDAVRAHSAGSAFAGFQEDITGTLSPGKRADFVVFDRDLSKAPAEKLPEARVRFTVVEGRVMYSRV